MADPVALSEKEKAEMRENVRAALGWYGIDDPRYGKGFEASDVNHLLATIESRDQRLAEKKREIAHIETEREKQRVGIAEELERTRALMAELMAENIELYRLREAAREVATAYARVGTNEDGTNEDGSLGALCAKLADVLKSV